jgi:lambda family phage portal protein
VSKGRRTKEKVKAPAQPPRRVQARFDSAQTNNDNKNHWLMADGLSAVAAASPAVRRTLRNRSRYEVANNSYASGIIDTIAIDCVGTGPQLQMTGAKVSDDDKKFIETEFWQWMQAIGLVEKLRCIRATRSIDGEVFGMVTTNEQIPSRVKLDLRLLEAEQVAASSMSTMSDPNTVDGIRFDDFGNPLSYEVLKEHPGGNAFGSFGASMTVPAAQMLHFFVPKRPGQRRGIPSLTPALPLFAQLRRWTLAVLAAAETAANYASVLETAMPADGEAAQATPFETVPIERNTQVVLPEGWHMNQFKPEQPVSTYEAFKHAILDEICRAELIPANLGRGNSSQFNFSSAKLDGTPYKRVVEVDRERIETQGLERLFFMWRREAVLIEGYLPQSLRTLQTDWSHNWMWPGVETGNPKDEAPAATERMNNGTSSLAHESAILGRDWQETADARARQAEYLRGKGLPVPWEQPAAPAAAAAAPATDPNAEEDPTAAQVNAALSAQINAARGPLVLQLMKRAADEESA